MPSGRGESNKMHQGRNDQDFLKFGGVFWRGYYMNLRVFSQNLQFDPLPPIRHKRVLFWIFVKFVPRKALNIATAKQAEALTSLYKNLFQGIEIELRLSTLSIDI